MTSCKRERSCSPTEFLLQETSSEDEDCKMDSISGPWKQTLYSPTPSLPSHFLCDVVLDGDRMVRRTSEPFFVGSPSKTLSAGDQSLSPPFTPSPGPFTQTVSQHDGMPTRKKERFFFRPPSPEVLPNATRIPGITWRSHPEWNWSQAECRAWVFSLCVDNFQHAEASAERLAESFHEFEPTIYLMSRDDWLRFLPFAGEAVAIHKWSLALPEGDG